MINDEIIKHLDHIVTNYINCTDQNDQLMIHKYSPTYIYTLVQKHLFDYEAIFNQQNKTMIDVFDFVLNLLQFTQEPIDATIYIIVQAVDFFKGVCEELQSNQIKFSDLSSYLCKYNPNLDEIDVPVQNHIITTHQFPPQKQFNKPKHRQVRSIDVHAPVMLGTLGFFNKRINQHKIYIDSQKNSNSSILKVQYQESALQILVLHQYSDKIYFYNPDCTLARQLQMKAPQLRNIIHDFAWSEEQQRLGIVFKDAQICFLDKCDNYSYEKFFTTKQDQSKIYYVQSKWITTSFDHKVSIWNMEFENCSIISHEALKNIVNILEVVYLQLVCIACNDKLTLWDLMEIQKPKLLFKLQINHTRLNNLIYFHSYHLLITSGFDSKINLYQLHKKYNDGDYVGQLEGHTSIVTAIQCIENSPIVISCDDRHVVKLWDIRVMKCTQSFDLELKQSISYCVMLSNLASVCFATTRLLIMPFEGRSKSLKNPIPIKVKQPQLHPIGIEFDALHKLFIVATNKDIRKINLLNGQTENIIKCMLGENDNELTTFKPIQQFKKLIVGTSKGCLKLLDITTGDLISEFTPHQNKITSLTIDYQNKLLFTSSLEGSWHIIKENKLQFETIRRAINVHSAVDICYVSLYHNLIITAGLDIVAVWNIEFGRLLSTIRPTENPKGIYILDGHKIIVIGGKNETHLIQFSIKDDYMQFTQLGYVQESCNHSINVNNMLVCGNLKGQLYQIDVKSFNAQCPRTPFNPYRQSSEDYTVSINNHKVNKFVLQETQKLKIIHTIQAHQKRLTQLDVIQLEGDNVLKEGENKILTASKDGCIKLFSFPSMIKQCQLNINHPLPTQWKCNINEHETMKFKIAFSLKIIQHIKTKQNLTVSQMRMFDPQNLFKKLMTDQKKHIPRAEPVPVDLLQNYYEPRDLVFEKVKQFYKSELQGLSLQQIEERKKQHIYAEMWANQPQTQEQEIKQSDEAQKDFKQLQAFLHPNFRNKAFSNQIDYLENIERIHQFEQKLDKITQRDDNQSRQQARRMSKLNITKLNKPDANRSTRQSARQSLPFFQYATERKLASIPASTDTSQRSTYYGYGSDTIRDELCKKLAKSKFLSQNVGSLLSDLEQNQKKEALELGENTMRKTSSLVFNQIVHKLNDKLRESKYKKFQVKSNDNEFEMQMDRLLSRGISGSNNKNLKLISKRRL